MRVGHFMQGIWDPGGVASYIRRISQALLEMGHEVFYFDSEERTGDAWRNVIRVQDATGLYRSASEKGIDLLHLHLLPSNFTSPELPSLATIHGHYPYCSSGTEFLQALRRPCPHIHQPARCLAYRMLYKCGSRKPDRILHEFAAQQPARSALKQMPINTVSQFMKARMIRAGISEQQIRVIYLPAPAVKEVVPPSNSTPPRFLFLGRLTPQKGVQWLLDAMAKTSQPMLLDIGGEGEEEKALKHQAVRLGLQQQVTFHGWLMPDQTAVLLKQARALVFPSLYHEPGGTVAFEAMANQKAVVMSRVGGMPEIVQHEQNGLLVPPGDTNALAAALDRLAADYTLACVLGERGRKDILEKYTLEHHMDHLMESYKGCLQQYTRTEALSGA